MPGSSSWSGRASFSTNSIAAAQDPEDVFDALWGQKKDTLQGKPIVRSGEAMFFQPDPRSIVILVKVPDADAGKLLSADKAALRNKELLEQVNRISGNTFWAALALENSPRLKQLRDSPEWKDFSGGDVLGPIVDGARLLTVTGNLEDGSLKIEVSLTCKDAAAAASAQNVLKPLADKMLPGLLKQVTVALDPTFEAFEAWQREMLAADLGTLALRADGPNLKASATIKKETVRQIAAAVEGFLPKPEPRISAKESRRTIQFFNNLKHVGLALHSFHDSYRRLPPAAICDPNTGKPLLSWRVAILPFVEQLPLYNKFKLDEPWDSPHNIKLLPLMPNLYAAPDVKTREPHSTFIQAFVGKNAAFEIRPSKGFLGADGLSLIQDFPRGTSNTWGVAEAAEPVPWTKPAELEVDMKKPLPRLGGTVSSNGFYVIMMDGSTRLIPMATDEKTRQSFIQRFKDG